MNADSRLMMLENLKEQLEFIVWIEKIMSEVKPSWRPPSWIENQREDLIEKITKIAEEL